MSVNLEIKGTLAKLLATEDLIIENKQVETACFNVQTRVLTLPMWERADEIVYDMLVGHEVGHALFTPNRNPRKGVPQSFINVTEDARIEKLMKRKYLGLGRTFYNAYQTMFQDDFFELDGEDIDALSLADKINLHYKVGAFLAISFNEEEQKIVDLVGDAETFEEAEDAAEILYKYCKDHHEDTEDESEKISIESMSLEAEIEKNEMEKEEKTGDSIENKDENEQEEGDAKEGRPDLGTDDTEYPLEDLSEGRGKESDQKPKEKETEELILEQQSSGASLQNTEGEPRVQTDDMLKQKIRDLISNDSMPNEYLELPDVNLDTIINSNEEVHSYIKKEWAVWEEAVKREDEEMGRSPRESYFRNQHLTFESVDNDFIKLKKNSQKAVNYLVKEFEMKKAASAYARAATSKTGVLDTGKLHTYKFNDDLFKKVTTFQEGQSHGLIFILDWSGSMNTVMKDTIKQLYNLIWFCKKVNIPFKVYAFTYEYNRLEYDPITHRPIEVPSHYTPEEGHLVVEDRFSLMEFFTSNSRPKDLEEQMKNIWRIACAFRDYGTYPIPPRMNLSGTPLNETVIALNKIIPVFQKECGMEKVQCVILTDGETHHLPRHKLVERPWEKEPFMGQNNVNPHRDYLRNRKTGRTYKVPPRYHEFTQLLLKYVNDIHTDVNFIGIRVMPNRDATYFINRYCGYDGEDFDKAKKQWKKFKSCSLPVDGYKKYIGMSNGVMASDDMEYVVPEEATKQQLKSYFNRSLKDKQLNKKVLSEFVELIA
tara:strand:- start:621 stop:2921 length:2301 start_codon:yes stop_codon:yes gene_type:complete